MRELAPFQADDLAEMDEQLFSRASAVIAMEDAHDGRKDPTAIALRHDVDGAHALAVALKVAEWEHDRGYRSTFYFLHTSPYWHYGEFERTLEQIAGYGHEIGIHTNALAEALRTGRDPDEILEEAIATLRDWGHRVRGVAGHGDPFCNRDRADGEITFANDEQFLECARPQEGKPDRTITRGKITLTLNPKPLDHFGLDYEALWSAYPFPFRISDSGGKWLNPGFEETVERWQGDRENYPTLRRETTDVRQLHFLWHPDWWAKAFTRKAVAV